MGVEDGAVADKVALVTLITSGALRFPAIDSFPGGAIVRWVGDVGVVVSRTSMTFDNPEGTTFSADIRYTHILAADASGIWRLLSAQGTAIKRRRPGDRPSG
ncbi:hypothetical protein ACQPZ8_32260 [Actinomadura nitritigenes]|uniref:hypothetical protein n=1 Tax=Actinomadura nitritigenes TaxID=134602 RepID=UPI003D8E5566